VLCFVEDCITNSRTRAPWSVTRDKTKHISFSLGFLVHRLVTESPSQLLGVVAAPASSPLCLMEVAVERLGARPVQPSPTLHFRPAPPLVDRPPLSHTPGRTSTDGTSWEMRVASEHCLAHPWDGTHQGEQMHIMGMITACKACSPGVYLCALKLVFWCALAVYLRAWFGILVAGN
jgi:hypothetical protein